MKQPLHLRVKAVFHHIVFMPYAGILESLVTIVSPSMAACEFCSFLPISRLQDGAGQCYNKPGFYAVLGIPVDMPVFNNGDSDSLAVMP